MMDRRVFLAVCSQFGLASTLFPGVLWAMADDKAKVTREMIDNAALIADVPIADDYKEMMLESLNNFTQDYDLIYKLKIGNQVAPAIVFDPVPPGVKLATASERRPVKASSKGNAANAPKNLEDVAFYSVAQLAELVRTRKVSSSALTDMYLE